MSSRRANAGSRTSSSGRRSALEEIRRLREGGGGGAGSGDDAENTSRIATYKPKEESIYKAMTEEEYEELVRQRRSALPFVENDDTALGYFDDGEEQFFESDEERQNDEEGEDEDGDATGKKRSAGALSSSYARRAKKIQRAKLGSRGDQKITNMFFSASAAGPKPGAGTKAGSAAPRASVKRDIDLDSMLDDLTSNPTATRAAYTRPVSYSSGNGSASAYATSVPVQRPTAARALVREIVDEDEDDGGDQLMNGGDDEAMVDDDNSFEQDDVADEPMADAEPENEDKEEAVEKEEEKMAPVLSKRELLLRKAREAQLQTTAPTARALLAPEPVTDPHQDAYTKTIHNGDAPSVPSNEVSEWWQASSGTAAEADATMDGDEATVEPASISGDSLQMYWMDAVEVRDRPGKIYLIGKVKTPENTYKSCCVVVNNLERYMYLVPKLDSSEEALRDLPKPAQQQHWMAMHDEIRKILIPSCITLKKEQDAFQTKLVERDYAFELADMPRGKHLYLKVKYPARYPSPPSDVCTRGGRSFRRICGAFTRPLETFLIRRKLLGPGWIEIKHVCLTTETVSFCSVEYETLDPKFVTPLQAGSGSLATPPLTVMSLSLKTFCNPQSGKHEIVALSCITESGVSPDGAASGKRSHALSHFTAIRPLDSTAGFPASYVAAAKSDARFAAASSDSLKIEFNERALLSCFLNRVQVEDPDVVVGHNLHKYTLDLLLSRVDHYHLGGLWSKLTRMRRGRLQPMNVGDGWSEYRMDDVVNGRLCVDTYVSAKELLTSQSNYSLSHLVQRQLGKQRLDVEMADIPQILHGGERHFVQFLRHTLDDAMFVLQLMHKLEVLPLSKQLASLCGYLWTRTLEQNKRAERIEYLLLHEFARSKRKFIVPEKYGNKKQDGDKGGRRKEPSYAGGMVFAPKKGLYDNFVVLLDFNSLYPSIIREYNICFTTVERQLVDDAGVVTANKKNRKKKAPTKQANAAVEGGGGEEDEELLVENGEEELLADDADIPPLPSSACDEGVLPSVIKRLLESRKQVKHELKLATQAGNVDKALRLDIRQKAIKLTANSMYGCLGFRFSRFYAKPIAALITSTGRQTLQRAKEVAEQECGYDVIYGDTDSIMVDSRSVQLEDAKRIGREIQVQCNKHFRLLELEVDYIFKAILLLNKKKYAALVTKEAPRGGEISFEKEVKGLDMVRRDWCVISKTVGMEILDFILSGSARDDVVERIHEHLEQVAGRIRSGLEPVAQFVITKSLNKQPEAYPDRAKQYHVQVALALRAQGQPIGIGSHIPYVLCREEEPGSGRRAYHPDEVARANGQLTVDVEWYLESQIHPPVNRLCAHIEGTSSPQLAHCLGLDTAKFAHSLHGNGDENDAQDAIPSVLQDDADRFKACAPLELTCRSCRQTNAFPGVYHNSGTGSRYLNGLQCVNPACQADCWGYDQEGMYGNVGDDLLAVLANKLHVATRAASKRYYEAWVVCSDATCKTRTQKQSLRGNGNICSAPGCRALVAMEYPDVALYTQLKYFASLFDVDRAQKKILSAKGNEGKTELLPPLADRHRHLLKTLLDQAQALVRQNDYNWVKPAIWQTLFA